ncbi:MAG: hypothetical protein U1C66_00965, partial [Patescibacteria group bacterium]|nr:hypothetical protein [Patescibacteria group bacterium]
MRKSAVFGLLQTTRSLKSFFVALLLGALSGSIFYGVETFLFLSFSFVFNDWVDADKDIIGHPNRAIPSGK